MAQGMPIYSTPETEDLYVHVTTGNKPFTMTSVEELLREDGLSLLTPAMVFICILISAGIPGNIVSILVYGTQLKSVTGRYAIIALAVCDIVNCCTSIPVEIFIMTRYWSFDNAALCKMSRFMTYAMNNSSGLILLAIAIERYRAICQPYKPKIPNTLILKTCVVLIVFGTLLALPALWIYGTQTDFHRLTITTDNYVTVLEDRLLQRFTKLNYSMLSNTNISRHEYFSVISKRCLIDDTRRKTSFAYSHFGFITISSIVVWVVLLVLYIQIGRRIARLKTGRGNGADEQRMRSSAIKKKQATMILFLITLAFQLSFIPFIVISNIRFFTEPELYNNLSRQQKMLYHLCLRSYYLNSAINPFIYCISSSNFRSAILKMVTRVRRRFHGDGDRPNEHQEPRMV